MGNTLAPIASPGRPPEGFPQLEGLFSGAFQVSSSNRHFGGSEPNAVAIRVPNDTSTLVNICSLLYSIMLDLP